MDNRVSFIERQFPVSKVSKESFKERKANNGQTLTGLGKWWGRKPLILVRAAILGCLLPATDNPAKDMEMFLRLLGMDESGLALRREKSLSTAELYSRVTADARLNKKYGEFFSIEGKKVVIDKNAPKDEIAFAVFRHMSYDDKLTLCVRPEQLKNISDTSWAEINNYYGTSAKDLQSFVKQMSEKRYEHNVTVGDCFCGGGSIPFEAARIGCDTYASDLNPIAGLLTWADLNIAGASAKEIAEIREFQQEVYDKVNREFLRLGIETNELGDRAVSYIYCVETVCPECGTIVPMSPSWVIGKGTKTIAQLVKNGNKYDFDVKMGASTDEMKAAENGTVSSKGLICPHCGKITPISVLRKDKTDENGNTVYGLRQWEKSDFEARPDDIYHERLYAIKYEHVEIGLDGKAVTSRYYRAPQARDLENEDKVRQIVSDNFTDWQEKGYIPNMPIESGYNTDQIIRERGWKYWHQLFNCRQLLTNCLFVKESLHIEQVTKKAAALLGINKVIIFNSKLSMWVTSPGVEKTVWIFTNQAFNTFFNYGCSACMSLNNCWNYTINNYPIKSNNTVSLNDAHNIYVSPEIWICDPPYKDAVNYHELSEIFISWDKVLFSQTFPQWYIDSKRILAIRGDEHFSATMIEIYTNLAKHMPDNGMQIVMFTHSDPAVWAQLAIIMWKSGLKVTAAWNIATETEAAGLKSGNYVKGTVLLVLRKQTGGDEAFLDEIEADIRSEVKNQIDSMQKLDDKEEPNFSDPDYVLAAYAASLKVLTSYPRIEDLDLDYELNLAITNPSKSAVVKIIENAKKIAFDCVIPAGFESYNWKELTNAERFYIKGLESEKKGNYQISTYQEFARGFSIGGYSQLMADERANSARLKTPFEMASRTMNNVPDFQESLMRIIFTGIYVGIKEDMEPQKALGYIKGELADYWDKRALIKQILSFLVDAQDITNMQPHWTQPSKMAELLLAAVQHDSV